MPLTPATAAASALLKAKSAAKSAVPKGHGKHYAVVKGEFLTTLVLVLLYPLAVRKYSPSDWIRRVIAVWLVYVVLLLVARTGLKSGRIAAGIGGLIVLGSLLDRGSADGESKVAQALTTVAKALQPGGTSGKTSGEETLFSGTDWPIVEKHFYPRQPKKGTS